MNADAIGLLLGMACGVLAGLPAALLVLFAGRGAAPVAEPTPAPFTDIFGFGDDEEDGDE